jgi:hypothetical protein
VSRAEATFRRSPPVEETVVRDLVAAVIARARLERSALAQVARETLVVVLNRREQVWATALADLRRHSLAAPGVDESEIDRAQAAYDVRLGIARLLASGLHSTRGAWCDLAAVAIVALTADARGLVRRELLGVARDVRAEAVQQLSLDALELLAQVKPASPAPAQLEVFASQLEVKMRAFLVRFETEARARPAPVAVKAQARPKKASRRRGVAGAPPTLVEALLTIEEACEYLGLSRSALYRRLADPSSG